MVMTPRQILGQVTGKNPPTFLVGDCVTGRGDLIGKVLEYSSEGDVKVRWEDGEEWTYPENFLTSYTHPAIPPPPSDTETPPVDFSGPELPSVYPQPPKEVRLVDETTGAQKGMKPERFELIPWDALAEVARVYAYGAKKYEARNWERGYPWSWSFSAACRHLWRWMCGEDRDPETGCHHAAHACFHCLAIVAYAIRNVGTDDRP